MKNKLSKILGVVVTLVLLTSLFAFAAPVAADVYNVSVTLSNNAVSGTSNYLVKLNMNVPFGALVGTIDIMLPTTTDISGVTLGTITCNGTSIAASTALTKVDDTRIVTLTVAAGSNAITTPSYIEAQLLGVINPTSTGSFTLKVKTSKETTEVESKSYTIGVPGLVTRFNKDGNYVGVYTTILAAVQAANEYDTIKVGPGEYVDPIVAVDFSDNHLTIVSTDGKATTIIKTGASITCDTNYVTFDGFTFRIPVINTGTNFTVKNSTFIVATGANGGVAGNRFENQGADCTVTNCTFDTTSGTSQEIGLRITTNTTATTTISGCTFTMDDGTGAAAGQDLAVTVEAAVTKVVLENSTITGTKGTGFMSNADCTATIENCTFKGLGMAIQAASAVADTQTLNIKGNVIQDSVLMATGTNIGAIDIVEAKKISIGGNTIKNGTGYSVYLRNTADADNVVIVGNNLISNTLGLKSEDAAPTAPLVAVNNWWGNKSGPTFSGNVGGTGDKCSDYVDYEPWLNAEISAGRTAAGTTSLDAKTASGVIVEGLTAATVISGMKYAANPTTVTPEYAPLTGAWFDVCVVGGTGTASIKLYGTGVDKNTDAYFWSGLESKWLECSDQGASATGGYVWVTVSTTTTPSLTDLSGLPFVLVAAPEAAADVLSLSAPEAGATVPLTTNVPFTWASITGATSYKFELSAKADMSSPLITATCAGTAYTYTGTLTDGNAYYWQVTAMRESTVKGKSDVGAFIIKTTTTAPPPAVTVQAPPPADVVVNVPPAEPAPTPGYIWAIIAIGAILVVTLIVLILRTRRVA